MSTGIDYGNGQTNIDKETGIRYGVISPNSVMPEALDDIYSNGEDMIYTEWKQERFDEIESAIQSAIGDYVSDRILKQIVEGATDAAEDCIGEDYESDSDGAGYDYTGDGYHIQTSSLGLYVLKSPYVTRTWYCSPCCPGAGNLDSPDVDGVLTYALGPEWFDEHNPMPYAVEPAPHATKV